MKNFSAVYEERIDSYISSSKRTDKCNIMLVFNVDDVLPANTSFKQLVKLFVDETGSSTDRYVCKEHYVYNNSVWLVYLK